MQPITLPLVVAVPAAMGEGAFGVPNAPILQVQMETLGGQIYLVPLSAEAAVSIVKLLVNWPPIQDSLSGQEPPEPTRRQ